MPPAAVTVGRRPSLFAPLRRRVYEPVVLRCARLVALFTVPDAWIPRVCRALLAVNVALGLGVAGLRADMPMASTTRVLVATMIFIDFVLVAAYGGGRCPARLAAASARVLECAARLGVSRDAFAVDRDTRITILVLAVVPGLGLTVEAVWTFQWRLLAIAGVAAAKTATHGLLVRALLRRAALRRRRSDAYRQQRDWDAVREIVATLRSDVDGGHVCCVCQDDVEDDAVALPCGHVLHATCAAQWWINSPTCPLCKGAVDPSKGGDAPPPDRRPRGPLLRRLARLLAAKAERAQTALKETRRRRNSRRVAIDGPGEEKAAAAPPPPDGDGFDAIPDHPL